MKLYHTTSQQLWNDVISKEGLIPICEPEQKNVENCDEAIYFTRNIGEAEHYAVYRPKPRVILEVDIADVLDNCQSIELDHHHWPDTVLATPFYIDREKIWRDKCIIPPDKIKVVET